MKKIIILLAVSNLFGFEVNTHQAISFFHSLFCVGMHIGVCDEYMA